MLSMWQPQSSPVCSSTRPFSFTWQTAFALTSGSSGSSQNMGGPLFLARCTTPAKLKPLAPFVGPEDLLTISQNSDQSISPSPLVSTLLMRCLAPVIVALIPSDSAMALSSFASICPDPSRSKLSKVFFSRRSATNSSKSRVLSPSSSTALIIALDSKSFCFLISSFSSSDFASSGILASPSFPRSAVSSSQSSFPDLSASSSVKYACH
mmetsp:Transcript_9211/g.18771  ORF Transcript_9211/g.18771 Transcript_9211/m.18771 type:complete len:209 (+) Transcript_9211:891-1517(+)